jgi:hypothetical protein
MESHMNMQVVSAPAAALPVPAPVQLHDADEPIIRLIKAYQDGCKAYNELPDEVTDGPYSGRAAEETYAPYLCRLSDRAPAIQTVQGAIAALTFALDESGRELDGCNVGSVIRRTLEFLESAAGAALVHPDAELLALGAQLAPIRAERQRIEEQVERLTEQRDLIHADRTGLSAGALDIVMFGRGILDSDGETFCPFRISEIKHLEQHMHAAERSHRLTELQKAAAKWREALDEFDETSGLNRLELRDEELYELDWPLRAKIRACRAKTTAGLAVKAMLVKDEWPRLWKQPIAELEIERETIRSLVDDLLPAEA